MTKSVMDFSLKQKCGCRILIRLVSSHHTQNNNQTFLFFFFPPFFLPPHLIECAFPPDNNVAMPFDLTMLKEKLKL